MIQKTSPADCRKWAATLAIVALLASVVAAPAWARKKKKDAAQAPALVWPLPPEQPRIKYVDSIYGAADVEPVKKASFLDRLAGIQRKEFKPGFIKPYGIATDSRGRVYVTDSGQAVVFVFDPEQKQVGYLGRGAQVRLRVPIGIAVDARDRIWVADAVRQQVYAFDPEGNALLALGQPDELSNPVAVAVDDSRQRLYIVDSKAHKVKVYSPETGQPLGEFGGRGTGPGQFNFPTNIALDRDGRVYVTDTMNFRVQIFDAEGRFLEEFGRQGTRFGQFLKPKGIAIDSFQNIYVVDSDFDNFQIFDQQNRLLMFVGGGGQIPGRFWLPAGIHVDRNNRIYVADQNNRRIQIFQLLDGTTEEPGRRPALADASKPAVPGGDAGVNENPELGSIQSPGPQKEKNTP
jgi:DNA-binding beta-propeller fold protein YncE